MKRSDLFKMFADAIENGDYKEIEAIEQDGVTNIRVTFDSFFCMYFNKDGFIRINATEDPANFPYKYEDMIQYTDKKRAEYIKDKLGKWEAQKAQLEELIADAKSGKIKIKERDKHDESLEAVKQRCREAKEAKRAAKAAKDDVTPQGGIWNRFFGN